jgi:hypothetical protein
MINISRLLKARLAAASQTTCTCWLAVLTNGNVRGFTSLDQSITFNLEQWLLNQGMATPPGISGTGNVTYDAQQGYVSLDLAGGSDLSPDTTEIDGVLQSPSITEADLYAGIWDFASVTVFIIDWSDFLIRYPIVASSLIYSAGSAYFENNQGLNLQTGDQVQMFNANNNDYNIMAKLTYGPVGSPAQYGYPIVGTPPTPDTSTTIYFQIRSGPMILRSGHLGQVSIERETFKANLQGVDQAFSRNSVELTSSMCRAELGDTRCKVPLVAPVWAATTGYTKTVNGDASLGSIVMPLTPHSPNYYAFFCTTTGTSGGSEPSWNFTIGATTTDGSVVWTCQYAYTISSAVSGVAVDNQTIYDTSLIQPGPSGGVTITGITQANPGHVTTASPLLVNGGSPITISGVVGMTEVNTDTIAQNVSSGGFDLPVDTSTYAAYVSGGTVVPLGGTSGFFDYGVLTWLTGANAGLEMEIRNYQPGQLTLQLPMSNAIAPGDTYSMHAGCAKGFLVDCKGRFNNARNFRAEPYLPGLDILIQIGKQTAA